MALGEVLRKTDRGVGWLGSAAEDVAEFDVGSDVQGKQAGGSAGIGGQVGAGVGDGNDVHFHALFDWTRGLFAQPIPRRRRAEARGQVQEATG